MSYKSILKAINEKNKNKIITLSQLKTKIKELAQSLVIKTSLMNIYTKYRLIPLARDRNRISNFIENITPTNDNAVIHSFYQEFFENMLGEINSDKVIDEFQKERNRLTNEWEDANRILETCPGKDLIEKIGHWVSTEYGIQKITALDLCHHSDADDVDHDFNQFVEKILKNCNYDTGEYLRNYEFTGSKIVEFYESKSYFNNTYYLSSPELNSNHLYVQGTIGNYNVRRRTENTAITIYAWDERKNIGKISLGRSTKIINMIYDRKYGLLFASAEIRNKDELIDSVLIIDPVSRRVHTKELLWDYKEGKEGALSDLVVTALDERNGIIYVASVYSQGGNKVLYMIRYSIEGTRVEWFKFNIL